MLDPTAVYACRRNEHQAEAVPGAEPGGDQAPVGGHFGLGFDHRGVCADGAQCNEEQSRGTQCLVQRLRALASSGCSLRVGGGGRAAQLLEPLSAKVRLAGGDRPWPAVRRHVVCLHGHLRLRFSQPADRGAAPRQGARDGSPIPALRPAIGRGVCAGRCLVERVHWSCPLSGGISRARPRGVGRSPGVGYGGFPVRPCPVSCLRRGSARFAAVSCRRSRSARPRCEVSCRVSVSSPCPCGILGLHADRVPFAAGRD